MSTIWLLALSWAFAGEPVDLVGTDAPAALQAPARSALAAADAPTLARSSLSDGQLGVLAVEGGWRVRARAAAALVWRREPDRAALISTVGPIATRSGVARFTDRALRDSDAAPLLVERLVSGSDAPGDRQALVEALRLTGGDWSEAAAGLLVTEADAGVRAQLAGALADADGAAALAGLAIAAEDADAGVRAAAMRAIGGRDDGAAMGAVVVAALRDGDAGVRGYAARAAGWLGLPDAWSGLVALLGDKDADVRLQTVNALVRLDPAAAAALPALARLRSDTDARVARAAGRALGD